MTIGRSTALRSLRGLSETVSGGTPSFEALNGPVERNNVRGPRVPEEVSPTCCVPVRLCQLGPWVRLCRRAGQDVSIDCARTVPSTVAI